MIMSTGHAETKLKLNNPGTTPFLIAQEGIVVLPLLDVGRACFTNVEHNVELLQQGGIKVYGVPGDELSPKAQQRSFFSNPLICFSLKMAIIQQKQIIGDFSKRIIGTVRILWNRIRRNLGFAWRIVLAV